MIADVISFSHNNIKKEFNPDFHIIKAEDKVISIEVKKNFYKR